MTEICQAILTAFVVHGASTFLKFLVTPLWTDETRTRLLTNNTNKSNCFQRYYNIQMSSLSCWFFSSTVTRASFVFSSWFWKLLASLFMCSNTCLWWEVCATSKVNYSKYQACKNDRNLNETNYQFTRIKTSSFKKIIKFRQSVSPKLNQ